jgi:hypothetical protein
MNYLRPSKEDHRKVWDSNLLNLGIFYKIQNQKVVDAWLAEMEDYIHATKVGQHSDVELAQSYLKGYASTQWRTVKQEEGKTHG